MAACEDTIYGDAADAFKMLINGVPDVPVTRDQIRQIPYATIRAKIGSGQRSVLVLSRYDGPDLHWVSADRVALTTRKGRLVKTAGLPENLKESAFVEDDPVALGLQSLTGPAKLTRLIDIEPGAHYGVPVESELIPEATEAIEILDLTYDTVRVRERGHAPLLDWSFENLYWAERKNGFVWKSVQFITPGLPSVELEVLKKAT